MKKRLLFITIILILLLTACSSAAPEPAAADVPEAEGTSAPATPTPVPTKVPVKELTEHIYTPVPTATAEPEPLITPTPTPEPTPTPIPDGLFITNVSITQGVVVSFEVKERGAKMAGYYFGSIPKPPKSDNHDWLPNTNTYIKTCKWPGNYWLWVRDTNGNIYGPEPVVIDENCYLHNQRFDNTEYPTEAYSTLLPKLGYSLKDLNALIADAVAVAGPYTREAVVVAIYTQFDKLQSFGLRTQWFLYGNWPLREEGWYIADDWGTFYSLEELHLINNKGKKVEAQSGTHCNGFIVYSFKLAGLNLRNTGKMGQTGNIAGVGKLSWNKVGTYEGLPGDVLQSATEHEMLIIDRYDEDLDGESDGYMVAESNNTEGGQVYCKKPFEGYSDHCKVFCMDGAFYNTGTQTRMLKYWQTYHIPESAWPDYLREAVKEKTQYEIVLMDDCGSRKYYAGFKEAAPQLPPPRDANGNDVPGARWSIDLSGVSMEQNYVLYAVYGG